MKIEYRQFSVEAVEQDGAPLIRISQLSYSSHLEQEVESAINLPPNQVNALIEAVWNVAKGEK